jgi:hypothetical protein
MQKYKENLYMMKGMLLKKTPKKELPPPRGVPGHPWSSERQHWPSIHFSSFCLPSPPEHTNGSPIYGGYQH